MPDLLTTSLASIAAIAVKPVPGQKGAGSRELGFDVLLADTGVDTIPATLPHADGGKDLPEVPGIGLPITAVSHELAVPVEAGAQAVSLEIVAALSSAETLPPGKNEVPVPAAKHGASAEDAFRAAAGRGLPNPGFAAQPASTDQAAPGSMPAPGTTRLAKETAPLQNIVPRGLRPGALHLVAGSKVPATVKDGAANGGTAHTAPERAPPGDPAVPTAQLLRASTSLRAIGMKHAPSAETSEAPGKDAVSPQPATERSTPARVIVPQPAIAPAEGSASSTGQSVLAPLAQVAASGPAPLMTSAPSLTAPADIDAMIDRMVEARQAAQSGYARISISHAEFGQVGIRIEQAAATGMLGVTLNSADPDFAPAVQAALADRSGERAGERSAASSEPMRQESSTSRNGDGFAQGGQSASNDARSSGDQSRSAAGTAALTQDDDSGSGGDRDEPASSPRNSASSGRYA